MRRVTLFPQFCLLLWVLSPVLPLKAQTISHIANSSGFNNFGQVGEQVTIWGTAFYSPTPVVSVKFNGVSIQSGSITSDNTISVQVPPGATTGPVTVQKSGGPLVFSPEDFVVIGAGPYVDNFTPTNGTGGTPIDINGVNFSTVTSVQFNGASVPKASFLTHTPILIRLNTPSGVATGTLTLVSSLGNHTTSSKFYVPPVISGLTPSSGVALSDFTITGQNFTDASEVKVGGVDAPFIVNSNTEIVATVPFGASTGPVRVTTPGGLFQTTSSFTVLPLITAISPTAGGIGTPVVISGANLNVAPVSVRFNGVSASINNISFSAITATAPASSSGPVSVTTGAGTTASSQVFHYPPIISGFNPGFGGADTVVEIAGNSLTNATAVLFDGTPASSFTVVNNALIQATAPTNVSTGVLTVQAPGGVAVSADPFYAPAIFTGFLPTEGLPGTDVILFGENFEGATQVKFNGVNAPILSNTGTQIGTRVPTNSTTGTITITTPAGTVSSGSAFVVLGIADLRVNTFLSGPNPVTVGEELTLTMVPSNDGPNTASNVTASVLLAPGLNVKAASSDTQGVTVNTNGNPVVFSIGPLTLFANPTLTLVLVPQTPGSATNIVTLASSTFDPNTLNNTDVRVSAVQAVPELTIEPFGTDQIRIAWHVSLTGFVLQSTSLPLPGATWTTVSTTPTVVGDNKVVILDASASVKHYRLKK